MNDAPASPGSPASTDEVVVDGQAGQPIDLPIAGGPATGHSWQLDLPPGVVRLDDGPPRAVDAGTRSGAATGGCLRVSGPPGEHLLIARLARPWERDRPVRTVMIRLRLTA